MDKLFQYIKDLFVINQVPHMFIICGAIAGYLLGSALTGGMIALLIVLIVTVTLPDN